MNFKLKKIAEVIFASSLVFSSGMAFAADAQPQGKVQGNQIRITAAYNDDVIKAIEEQASKIKAENVELDLTDINDADFAAIVDKYQSAKSLYITSSKITNLEPLKKLPNIVRVIVESDSVTDFSPLASNKKLDSLTIKSSSIKSIAWMADLPELTRVYVEAKSLADLTGIPKSTKIRYLTIAHSTIDDLTPITNASNVESLSLKYVKIKDLTPIGTLKSVDDIDLYGASVADYSPLASIPKIKKLMAYATKDSDYSTLGKLKNVEYLNLGMTNIKDISFVPDMTGLKRIDFFNEEITDYSPIAKSNVEYLKIWQMKSPVDLAQVKGTQKLSTLELVGCNKGAPLSNLETISTFKELKELKVTNMGKCSVDLNANVLKGLSNLKTLYVETVDKIDTAGLKDSANIEKIWIKSANGTDPVDLAFLANTGKLKELHLDKVTVKNFDAIAGAASLETLDAPKAEGITSLAAAKALPQLRSVTVKKGSVPADDLKGFANPKARVTER